VITCHDYDLGSGQFHSEPSQLVERVKNGGIGGPDRMKQISGQHYDIGFSVEQIIHCAPERLRYVGLTLIDTVRRETVVLAKTEVQIGQMRELHRSYGLTQ
jgi:hypothetical protein